MRWGWRERERKSLVFLCPDNLIGHIRVRMGWGWRERETDTEKEQEKARERQSLVFDIQTTS